MLAIDLAAERNLGDRIGSLYKTWFIPPETGRYRFYMACDQQCRMSIAECPNTTTPLTMLLKLNSWTQTNAFFSTAYSNDNKKVSDWIHLEKGEPYYMEASYVEYDRSDHMTTGVEFEQTAIQNHTNSMKEIQELKISTNQTKEKTHVEVQNPDDGSFKVLFKNPNTGQYYPSKAIPCKATAGQFQDAVSRYYWDLIRSAIKVTRYDLDADGNDINIANTTLDTIRFEIEVVKLVANPTTT